MLSHSNNTSCFDNQQGIRHSVEFPLQNYTISSIPVNCKYRAEVRVSPDGVLLVDINDTDVNENEFLSEPQDKFHPRQTDFESVKKNSDEYIQIIEQEMNILVIHTHVIFRPRNAMLSLLTT